MYFWVGSWKERSVLVRFPAFRRHEAARIEANDAMFCIALDCRQAPWPWKTHIVDRGLL